MWAVGVFSSGLIGLVAYAWEVQHATHTASTRYDRPRCVHTAHVAQNSDTAGSLANRSASVTSEPEATSDGYVGASLCWRYARISLVPRSTLPCVEAPEVTRGPESARWRTGEGGGQVAERTPSSAMHAEVVK